MAVLLAVLILAIVGVWWYISLPKTVKPGIKTVKPISRKPLPKPPQKSEPQANKGSRFYNSGSVVGHRKASKPSQPAQPKTALPTPEGLAFRRDRELAGVKMSRLNQLTKSSAASERLIAGIKRAHPDQPLSWCVDKAIADLERDRFR